MFHYYRCAKMELFKSKKKYQHYCEELYQRIMVIVISLTVFLHLERKAEQIQVIHIILLEDFTIVNVMYTL